MQAQPINEAPLHAPVCEVCAAQDESLRAVAYPYVFSLLIMTFQRAFAGVYCARHQRRYHFLASLITSTVGWLGIPFGFLATPVALFKLARGGTINQAYSISILKEIAEKKLQLSDVNGAIRCMEEALKLQDDPALRERLTRLYQQHRSHTDTATSNMAWQFIAIPLLLGVVTFVGMVLGILEALVVWLLAPLFGQEVSILIAIVSWLPTVVVLFMGVLFVRALLRWTLHKISNTSVLLGSLVSFAATMMYFNSILQGEAVIRNLQALFAYFSFSRIDGFVALRSVLTHGGLDALIYDLKSGQLSGVIGAVLISAATLLSLYVGIEMVVHISQWKSRLFQVQASQSLEPGGSSIISWVTFGFLLTALVAIALIVYPGTYVNVERTFEQFTLGLNELDLDDPQTAMTHFQQAYEYWPDSATSRTYLGVGYSYMEQIDNSITELDAALEIDPDSMLAHLFKGYVVTAQGRFTEAVDEFHAVSAAQPQWGMPHAFLATLHYTMDQPVLAQREIEQAIQLQGQDGQTHSMIAAYYLSSSDFDKAEEYYLRAIALGNDPQDHIFLSRVYSSQKQYEKAEKAINNAEKQGASPADILLARNDLALMTNDMEAAYALSLESIERYPNNSEVWTDISFIHFHQGKVEESISDSKKALEINPYNSAAYTELAFAYQEQGNIAEATEMAEKALALNPKRDRIHYILGVCYMEQGMKAEAIHEFETFLELYWDRPLAREYKENAERFIEQLR